MAFVLGVDETDCVVQFNASNKTTDNGSTCDVGFVADERRLEDGDDSVIKFYVLSHCTYDTTCVCL